MKLLDLINAMLYGTNFPEGFRAGMSLRGFDLGSSRQLLSPREQSDLEAIRGKIACILTDCGFAEAAQACRRAPADGARPAPPAGGSPAFPAANPEAMAREVMKRLQTKRTDPAAAPGGPAA
jgi:4-hydroxy-tetrahydrodipicolinate synthase